MGESGDAWPEIEPLLPWVGSPDESSLLRVNFSSFFVRLPGGGGLINGR